MLWSGWSELEELNKEIAWAQVGQGCCGMSFGYSVHLQVEYAYARMCKRRSILNH